MSAVSATDARQGMTVRRLQSTVGAEIGHVGLRDSLSTADRDQITAAILQHKALFFRDHGKVPISNYGDFPRLLERILIADDPQYAGL